MDDLKIALKNVTKITPNQFCQWEISFFSGESHAESSTWESLFTAVDKNIKKNWVKYYVHFFLLAGKQVEYSCYVDLKSFLSVKSSAENSLEFRGGNRVRLFLKKKGQKDLSKVVEELFQQLSCLQGFLHTLLWRTWATHICFLVHRKTVWQASCYLFYKSRAFQKHVICEKNHSGGNCRSLHEAFSKFC